MNHRLISIAGIAGMLIVTGCGQSTSDANRLVITGSSTMAPMVNDMARHVEALEGSGRIDVQTGGSSRGLSDVRRGLADLGMVSRSPRDDEDDVHWIPVARDGIAVIVHTSNPIMGITTEALRLVYQNRIDSWEPLGGPDRPITVVNKADGRATLDLFLAYTGLDGTAIQADVIIGDNEHAIKTVIGDPYSIAYVSIGTAEYAETSGRPIRRLRLDGVVPSLENLRKGAYPFSRLLYLVAQAEPTEPANRFLAFLGSKAAHPFIEEHYFVPLER